MIKCNFKKALCICGLLMYFTATVAQIEERKRPEEWSNLVMGGRFMDRFLPMQGNLRSSDTWGASYVKPRYIDNGIEDRVWSYWGGNIHKGADSLYHLFVCGWLEASPKGHMEWPNSYVFNAVSDNPIGPFQTRNIIGKGHNPEVYRLKDGRYVLYVIDGRYVTDDINGQWQYGKFDFDARDRKIIEGLSNLSFAQREDGSFVMVCRGGGIWISKDGLSTYRQLTDKRVYPNVDGRFEDPVIWKDHVQYHMIVNDWLGRIAFYLRSKDGVKWVVDAGEAYMPGIAKHEDGTVEDWFKFERIKVYQDEHGRAVQANFAVIDTLKFEDKPYDDYSSKNIAIPLNPGVLLEMLDTKRITAKTKKIRIKVKAEEGFDPHEDIDLNSLHFGASTEVDYGRGAKLLKTEKSGRDLILVFNGKGNGIDVDEFAPKLLGKYADGKLLYGYTRLPYVDYTPAILSAKAPIFEDGKAEVEVQNFGLVESTAAEIMVERMVNGKAERIAYGNLPVLQPYAMSTVQLNVNKVAKLNEDNPIRVTIYTGDKILSTFDSVK